MLYAIWLCHEKEDYHFKAASFLLMYVFDCFMYNDGLYIRYTKLVLPREILRTLGPN